MAGLEIRVASYDHPDACRLIERVQAEFVDRYGSPDDGPVDVAQFVAPRGLFLVCYLDGEPVGTGAWRRSPVRVLDGSSAVEIKRMYVVPERRGLGWSRRVLAELERTAGEAGHDLLVLETGLLQPEAIGLYTSSGFEQVHGFGHYRDSPLSRCFAKRI